MSSALRALGRRVAAVEDGLGEPPADETLRTALALRAASRRERPRSGLFRMFAFGLAAGFATALPGWWVLSKYTDALCTPAPGFRIGSAALPGQVGRTIAAEDATVPLRFFEGSEVRLEPRTRARVTSVDARGAEVTLEVGTAHVEVTPRPGAHWLFRSGPFTVDVKGTRFDLAWDEQNDVFRLRLREGKVSVTGCAFGAGRTLIAGEEAHASCRAHVLSVTSFESGPATANTAVEAKAVPTPARGDAASDVAAPRASGAAPNQNSGSSAAVRRPDASRMAVPGWLELARSGRYAEAFARLQAADLEVERRKCGPAELLLLADTARLSEHESTAASAYHELRARFLGTPAAAEAAFNLGRLEAARARTSDATRWFRVYLDEAPDGPLAEAALGRLLEAELGTTGMESARATAAKYLARYPTGPRADVARRTLASDTAR